MKTYSPALKQALKEAQYKYIRFVDGEHILLDIRTGIYEVFCANKNHASWGLKYRNTHLEFARSLSQSQVEALGLK